MKENWIRKLKNILNEYEDYKEKKYWRRNYVWVCLWKENPRISADRTELENDCLYEDESRAVIISKGYNFIKWLFDKNKIDWSKFHKYSFYKKDNKYIQYYDLQSLLMALSISDSPIDLLISVLK